MKQRNEIDALLSAYQRQSNPTGKHAYSENLHNDTGSGCFLCDMCSCCTDCFGSCMLCSTGSCC